MAETDSELDEILFGIKHEISKQMNVLKKAAQTVFASHAEPDVYDVYDRVRETYEYRRRGDGEYGGTTGIANPDTYDVEVVQNAEGFEMTIISNLRGNPMYQHTEGWDPGNITDIIETGRGYHWKSYGHLPGSTIYTTYEAAGHPLPRPWMEKSGDDFVDNNLAEIIDLALKNYLGTDSTTVGG